MGLHGMFRYVRIWNYAKNFDLDKFVPDTWSYDIKVVVVPLPIYYSIIKIYTKGSSRRKPRWVGPEGWREASLLLVLHPPHKILWWRYNYYIYVIGIIVNASSNGNRLTSLTSIGCYTITTCYKITLPSYTSFICNMIIQFRHVSEIDDLLRIGYLRYIYQDKIR